MLNIAARARGHAAATAAVTSGTATNNPTTGKGFEIAIIPADPAAAAIPIQRCECQFGARRDIHERDDRIDGQHHQRGGCDEAEEIKHLTLL
jgi:hypothetical protein